MGSGLKVYVSDLECIGCKAKSLSFRVFGIGFGIQSSRLRNSHVGLKSHGIGLIGFRIFCGGFKGELKGLPC